MPVDKNSILLQGYENKKFFDEQRTTLSDCLPCYPAELRDISKLERDDSAFLSYGPAVQLASEWLLDWSWPCLCIRLA